MSFSSPSLLKKGVSSNLMTWWLRTPTYAKSSYENNPPTFHYAGWLIGIHIMAFLIFYDPYITVQYNPLYNLTNRVFSLLN